jgi:hypothetical protein
LKLFHNDGAGFDGSDDAHRVRQGGRTMRWVLIALVMGTTLAGCSARTAHMDDGYASPGTEERLTPVRKTRADDEDPGKAWSVRDFASPRGLY